MINYSPIKRIISRAYRELGYDFDEADAIELIGEAIREVATVGSGNYEEAVAFVKVENHQCLIPTGLCYIIQIARNQNPSTTESVLCPATVIEEADLGGEPVPLDCNGTPITDYELAYYRPYFDLRWEYEGWTSSTYYNRCWTPVRLSTNTFASNMVCQETGDICKLYQTSEDEYAIHSPYLRLSFKEGEIAIAYLRWKLDEDGYPLIPDEEEYARAAVHYMRKIFANREYDKDPNGPNQARAIKADQDWHWYCRQAKNKGIAPLTLDRRENLKNQNLYLLPRQQRYSSFFGRMGRPENRPWNNPRAESSYFRGYYL